MSNPLKKHNMRQVRHLFRLSSHVCVRAHVCAYKGNYADKVSHLSHFQQYQRLTGFFDPDASQVGHSFDLSASNGAMNLSALGSPSWGRGAGSAEPRTFGLHKIFEKVEISQC